MKLDETNKNIDVLLHNIGQVDLIYTFTIIYFLYYYNKSFKTELFGIFLLDMTLTINAGEPMHLVFTFNSNKKSCVY